MRTAFNLKFIMASAEKKTGEKIKDVSQFSTDGIQLAIKMALTDKELEAFDSAIEKLSTTLQESAGGKSTTSKAIKKRKAPTEFLPTGDEVFKTKILPQIQEKLADNTCQELALRAVKTSLCMNFPTNFGKMSIDELIQMHSIILNQEGKLTQLQLILRFQKGMLYTEAYNRQKNNENLKQWFRDNLGVSYQVVWNHITVAMLLKRFPRLFVCGLSFEQLHKHSKRFIDYLRNDLELHDKLAVGIEMFAQGAKVKIEASEVYVPTSKYIPSDPDSHYYHISSACDEEQMDGDQESFHQWMTDKSKDVQSLLSPELGEECGAIGGEGAGVDQVVEMMNFTLGRGRGSFSRMLKNDSKNLPRHPRQPDN